MKIKDAYVTLFNNEIKLSPPLRFNYQESIQLHLIQLTGMNEEKSDEENESEIYVYPGLSLRIYNGYG